MFAVTKMQYYLGNVNSKKRNECSNLFFVRQLNVTAEGRDRVNCDMIQNTVRIHQFLKDQWPVRSHVHLLGGRPVLFQLSKIVYNRSGADN